MEKADEVLAPAPFVPEVVDTIWKYLRFEKPAPDVYDLAIEDAARRPLYEMFFVSHARRETERRGIRTE